MPKSFSRGGQPPKRSSPEVIKTQRQLLKLMNEEGGSNAIDSLLSGKTLRSATRDTRTNKSLKTVEKLPKDIGELADVLVAGRKIEREISFKLEYAEKRVKDYCRRRFAEMFAATGNRTSSVTFAGNKSTFTFIQTKRMSLTEEKVSALNAMGVSVEGETELRGIRINYAAIQRNKLEYKLRSALESMNIPKEVLAECFQPDVQFRDSFFGRLSTVVDKTLEKGEELAPKLYEVLNVLNPVEQIRNADLPNLNSLQSYKLIHDSHVVEVGDVTDLDDEDDE